MFWWLLQIGGASSVEPSADRRTLDRVHPAERAAWPSEDEVHFLIVVVLLCEPLDGQM
jgi:hypothetical protein